MKQATTIFLRGQLPSGKNAVNITRTGHRYPSARFEKWRLESIFQAKPYLHNDNWMTSGEDCSVIVVYTPSDRRRRDVPGMIDALCHLFEKMRIVLDDCQFVDWQFTTLAVDKEHPGAEIHIREKVDIDCQEIGH